MERERERERERTFFLALPETDPAGDGMPVKYGSMEGGQPSREKLPRGMGATYE